MGFLGRLLQPAEVKDFYYIKQAIEDGLSGRLKLAACTLGHEIEEDVNELEDEDGGKEYAGRTMFLRFCRDCGPLLHVIDSYRTQAELYLKYKTDLNNENKNVVAQFYSLMTALLIGLKIYPMENLRKDVLKFCEEYGVSPENWPPFEEVDLIVTPIIMKIKHLRHVHRRI